MLRKGVDIFDKASPFPYKPTSTCHVLYLYIERAKIEFFSSVSSRQSPVSSRQSSINEQPYLLTANCRLWTADCQLPTVDCRLPIADCGLPTAKGSYLFIKCDNLSRF